MDTPSPAMYEERIRILNDELVRLRDRAVCSGCGQNVNEGGACETEGCERGELIPSNDLPGAMLENLEYAQEERAEWRFDWEVLRAEAKQLEAMRDTLRAAFADCLLALDEIGHQEVSERLRERWPEASTE